MTDGESRIHTKTRPTQGMRMISRDRIERVARIYADNKAASEALGIAFGSFGRLCREYGIETPYKRKLRHARDRRQARLS